MGAGPSGTHSSCGLRTPMGSGSLLCASFSVSCWIETSPQGKARLVLLMSLGTTLGLGGWHSGCAETGCDFTSAEVGTKNDEGARLDLETA